MLRRNEVTTSSMGSGYASGRDRHDEMGPGQGKRQAREAGSLITTSPQFTAHSNCMLLLPVTRTRTIDGAIEAVGVEGAHAGRVGQRHHADHLRGG